VTTASIGPGERELMSDASLVPRPAERLPEADRDLAERLNALSALAGGWDGEDAHPIDPASLRSSVAWVRSLMNAGLPMPEMFPVPDGGVQLEWSAGPVELELDIEPGASSVVFVCDDERSGQRFDGVLPGNESLLSLALARLGAYSAGRMHERA
jgi:hypothetical protein